MLRKSFNPPKGLTCPIAAADEWMSQPVRTADCLHVFDFENIATWINDPSHQTCPLCRHPLTLDKLAPAHELASLIADFKELQAVIDQRYQLLEYCQNLAEAKESHSPPALSAAFFIPRRLCNQNTQEILSPEENPAYADYIQHFNELAAEMKNVQAQLQEQIPMVQTKIAQRQAALPLSAYKQQLLFFSVLDYKIRKLEIPTLKEAFMALVREKEYKKASVQQNQDYREFQGQIKQLITTGQTHSKHMQEPEHKEAPSHKRQAAHSTFSYKPKPLPNIDFSQVRQQFQSYQNKSSSTQMRLQENFGIQPPSANLINYKNWMKLYPQARQNFDRLRQQVQAGKNSIQRLEDLEQTVKLAAQV